MSLRYIITGTGRCGTGFMSKVFQSAGIRCGHEQVFGRRYKRPGKLEADSSGFAVPYLEARDFTHATIIHLVRNPWDVMRNWLFDGETLFSVWAQGLRRQDKWLCQHCPKILHYHSPIARALAFYVDWNARISRLMDKGYRVTRWQVEGDPRDLMEHLCEVQRNNLYQNTSYNTRRRTRLSRVEVDSLLQSHPTPYGPFAGMADMYGYTEEEK